MAVYRSPWTHHTASWGRKRSFSNSSCGRRAGRWIEDFDDKPRVEVSPTASPTIVNRRLESGQLLGW